MNIEKFPGWRFHRTESPRIVDGPAEELALGPGWAEFPFEAAADEITAIEPQSEPAATKKGRKRS